MLKQEIVVRESGDVDLLHPLIQQGFQGFNIGTLFGRDKETIILQLTHPRTFQFVQVDILACPWGQVIILIGHECKGMHIVENHDHRFFLLVNLRQGPVDHLDLLLKTGV